MTPMTATKTSNPTSVHRLAATSASSATKRLATSAPRLTEFPRAFVASSGLVPANKYSPAAQKEATKIHNGVKNAT